jgi:hypothetical protein
VQFSIVGWQTTKEVKKTAFEGEGQGSLADHLSFKTEGMARKGCDPSVYFLMRM